MKKRNVIAIDLAKNVFQVCGLSEHNQVLFNKPIKRSNLSQFMANQPPTQVTMEACYSGVHTCTFNRVLNGVPHHGRGFDVVQRTFEGNPNRGSCG